MDAVDLHASNSEDHNSSHYLCKNCLRSYVEERTEGRVYKYMSVRGQLKHYECPFYHCEHQLSFEVVGAVYSPEENMLLMARARRQFAKEQN